MSAEITNGITKKKPPFEVGKAALVDKIVSLSLSLVPPRRVFWFLQGTPFLLPPGVLTLTLRVPERSTGGPPAGLLTKLFPFLSRSFLLSWSVFWFLQSTPFLLPPFLPPPPSPPRICAGPVVSLSQLTKLLPFLSRSFLLLWVGFLVPPKHPFSFTSLPSPSSSSYLWNGPRIFFFRP